MTPSSLTPALPDVDFTSRLDGACEEMALLLEEANAGKIHVINETKEGEPIFMLFATTEPILIPRIKAVIDAFNVEFDNEPFDPRTEVKS